jgi:hypothetical protein
MVELINIIVSQVSIWLPGLAAILGTVVVLLKVFNDARKAII